MSVRIPALFLAAGALALWNNPWIALAIVIGSIPVPWSAVIMANDRPPLPKGQARRYVAGGLPSTLPRALPSSVTGTPREPRTDQAGGTGDDDEDHTHDDPGPAGQ